MNTDYTFICNVSDTPEVKAAFDALDEFQSREFEQIQFIKRQCKAMEKESKERWDALFNAAKESGKISGDKNADDYSMHLISQRTQFAIAPRDNKAKNGLDLGDLLRGLFT